MPSTCFHLPDYKRGYNDGLKSYCTEKTAKEKGLAGVDFYLKNCPSSTAVKISKIYEGAKKLKALKNSATKIEKELTDLNSKIYDPKLPSDIKTHYRSIQETKKKELKSLEKQIYKIEG